MTKHPEADVAINEALVRALLEEQHPDLAALPLEAVDFGWDNVIFKLGEDLALRLPRRAQAHQMMLNEMRWLPFLAPRLPIPVPAMARRGLPGTGYPYHWAIVPWFEGSSAALLPTTERDSYALEFAGFFKALHVPAPGDAPRNPVRGVPLATLDAVVSDRLGSGRLAHSGKLAAAWELALEAAPHTGPRLWLHGDPHPHNLLLEQTAGAVRISAVIDFGDMTAGDPASDLAAAWLHFTARGRAQFRDALADNALYPPGTWDRARGWALHYGALMALLPPQDALHAVGVHALGQVLDGEHG